MSCFFWKTVAYGCGTNWQVCLSLIEGLRYSAGIYNFWPRIVSSTGLPNSACGRPSATAVGLPLEDCLTLRELFEVACATSQKNEICLCHLSRKTLQLPPKAETCEHPSQPQHETEGFLFNLFHLFTTRCNQHLSDSLGYTNPPGFRTVSTSMCRWFHGVYDVYVST
jgi:hypothetical protein